MTAYSARYIMLAYYAPSQFKLDDDGHHGVAYAVYRAMWNIGDNALVWC